MKPYPAYKHSGIDWIGEIPEHWKTKRIKHNTYVKGRIGWQGLQSSEFVDDGCYCVTGTDFVNGSINWKTCYRVSELRYDEDPYIQLTENDLLITKDGTIGKIALAKCLPGKATLNSGVFVTRPLNDEYITQFMYWLLLSSVFATYIDYIKSGSTILHLYQNTFVDFAYPLPSLSEQRAIASYLDDKTSKIDALIEKKQRLSELLKEQRTTIINQAVTKGIDPNVPARRSAAFRHAGVKMKKSGIDWLGEIPEHWEVKKLKYVAGLISGDGITSNEIKAEGDYPVYGGNGLRGYTDSFSHEGDYVLIGRQGALCGNINYAHGKFWASEHAVVATLNDKNNYIWFGELLRAMNLNQYSQSAAQPGLAVEDIKNLNIPVPPIVEQTKIVAYLDVETCKIDTVSKRTEKEIELLQEYRTALISEVVTGKVDVRDQVQYQEQDERALLQTAE